MAAPSERAHLLSPEEINDIFADSYSERNNFKGTRCLRSVELVFEKRL